MKFLRLLFLLPLASGLAPGGLHPAPHAHAAPAGAAKQLYTCGMHPQIIKDAPGDCPICGMKLTPVRANGGAAAPAAPGERKIKFYKSSMTPGEVSPRPGKDSMGMDLVPVYDDAPAADTITIDAGTIQKMNLKTGLVTAGPVRRTVRAVGLVAYDERGLRDITVKYEGWIERLYVDATWTPVRAGDPLFEIYSPDLYNAQLNYLVALRGEGPAGGPLTHAARARLELYDVSADFLAEIAKTGEARRTYTYRSPGAGFVIEKMAVAGQMMRPGEKFYRLADLSTVWINAQLYENDLGLVAAGQAAEVRTTYAGERPVRATVAQVLPQIEGATRTATARLVLANPDGRLRPGMFADVRLDVELAAHAVLVPDSAVLRSGERNTVFIARADGSFEPRAVQLGTRTDDYRYAVLSGLAAGDRVVISGQFMLDSESQLREAIQKMLRGDAAAPATADKPAGPTSAMTPAADKAAPLYTCPMPSHAHVVTDHPGQCPECAMTLVPTSDVAHGESAGETWRRQHARGAAPAAKVQPGGAVAVLPTGHPPIGDAPAMTELLALLKQNAPAAKPAGASADACGSCGLSQAAMAAGEPCEPGKQ
ncbi:MAG: efflux RND transporter periplasmic adaptor subunit [Opitutae bacterium]|nr:efflux RND transporter periplasmic adaptor subunit [Opitutae bacterium]